MVFFGKSRIPSTIYDKTNCDQTVRLHSDIIIDSSHYKLVNITSLVCLVLVSLNIKFKMLRFKIM